MRGTVGLVEGKKEKENPKNRSRKTKKGTGNEIGERGFFFSFNMDDETNDDIGGGEGEGSGGGGFSSSSYLPGQPWLKLYSDAK